MHKPDSLRAAIGAVLPDIARDPDKLKLWIDKGRVRGPMTPNRDFGMEYTVTLELINFADHPAIVFLAINDWLRENQPDLLVAGAAGYTFEADIIDATMIDLTIEVPLTEGVQLNAREGGGWSLEQRPEPVLFSDDEPITAAPALLKQIYWKDELLVE